MIKPLLLIVCCVHLTGCNALFPPKSFQYVLDKGGPNKIADWAVANLEMPAEIDRKYVDGVEPIRWPSGMVFFDAATGLIYYHRFGTPGEQKEAAVAYRRLVDAVAALPPDAHLGTTSLRWTTPKALNSLYGRLVLTITGGQEKEDQRCRELFTRLKPESGVALEQWTEVYHEDARRQERRRLEEEEYKRRNMDRIKRSSEQKD